MAGKQQIQMYVVVCHKLDAAKGPYTSFEEAVQAAGLFTQASTHDCVYLPVPLSFIGEMVSMEEFNKMKERPVSNDWKGGQYL
jgi:hypothetical protein